MSGLLRRLRARLRHRRFDDDLQEELRLHEALTREALEAGGADREEARAHARRTLGNITLMREDSRAVWIPAGIESIAQDVRYAVRTSIRQPGHAVTALTVLVLALSLITSLFTIVKALALEPWPVREPDRLVQIQATAGAEMIGPSVDEYLFIRQHATTLRGVAAHLYGGGARVRAAGRAETYPQVQLVSANFLDVLGARLHMGTGFIPVDDLPGLRRAPAIISFDLWRSYFAEDPAIVGQGITINATPFTVIGVLEPRVDGLARPVPLWLPLSALPALDMRTPAGLESPASANCCIDMVGRLGDGVDRPRARQEVQRLHERFTSANKRKTGVVELHGTSYADGPGARADLAVIPLLFTALGLVLVLACANVGNLQLARGAARRRELATRIALGAGRMRIVRQLLVEGLVLAGAAGAVSLAITAVLPAMVLRLSGDEIPPTRADRFVPDWQVLAVTAAICALSCLLFALAPALHTTRRTIPLGTLDRGGTRYARFRLREGFLAVQIAVCVVLLAGAGLVTRAIAHALAFDPGFQVEGVTSLFASLPHEAPADQSREFNRRLVAALEQRSEDLIAVADSSPVMESGFHRMNVVMPQESAPDFRSVERRGVSAAFFDVLGIPLLAGRTFASTAVGEAIVNQAFARAYLNGASPLGQVIREVDDAGAIVRAYTIVGVARDAYLAGLTRIEPVIFRPTVTGTLLTRGGPAAVKRVHATAAGLSAAATVRAWPLSDDLRRYLEPSRAGATAAWAIGLLGLVLAMVGVFGVFAYAVEERRREIGVRLALGAARAQIVAMLVSSSGRAMLAGLVSGLVLSVGAGVVLRAFLFGLSPVDPVAYGGTLVLLIAAAAVSTVVPARRACRVDPAVTLRED